VQGGSDTIVPPEVTQAVFSSSCINGGNIKFALLANISHSGSATATFPAVTDWLVALLAGKANVNSCTTALVARINDGSRRQESFK